MWVQNLLGTKEIPYFKELEKRGKKQGIAIGEERGKALGIAIGEERGEERGKAIGQIQLLQELRGFPVDSEETLRKLSPENLQAKLDQLKSASMDA